MFLRILMAVFLSLSAMSVPHAQTPTDIISVPLSAQERDVVLLMCDNAVWAARRQFPDSLCEFFRGKFETAAKEAKEAKAKADAIAKPAEQPKE